LEDCEALGPLGGRKPLQLVQQVLLLFEASLQGFVDGAGRTDKASL
jgi:hypothetical protein